MKPKKLLFFLITVAISFFNIASLAMASTSTVTTFDIWPDTGQTTCYTDGISSIFCPKVGFPLQDAEHCYSEDRKHLLASSPISPKASKIGA